MARNTTVRVKGEVDDGKLSPEEEKLAREAMEKSANTALSRGGTDVPVTETPKETLRQREAERKNEKKQEEFQQKMMDKARDLAPEGGGSVAIPVGDAGNFTGKWVRLNKGYVPQRMYAVMEGETRRVHAATHGRFLDKVQAGSLIELPADEARGVVKAGIAERGDEF